MLWIKETLLGFFRLPEFQVSLLLQEGSVLLSPLLSQSRSSHGMHQFCCPQRTYALYGKDQFPAPSSRAFLASAGVSAFVRTFIVLYLSCILVVELTSDLSIYSRDKSVIDVTCCTINGDCISFMELFTSKCEFLVLLIHSDIAASGYRIIRATTAA